MEDYNNCSTTSGLSYAYKIRAPEYKGTTTTNSSTYHNLKGYDAAKKHKIISPKPTSDVASIFYNFTPHDYRIPPVGYLNYNNSDYLLDLNNDYITSDYFFKDNKYFATTKKTQDTSPYRKISQGDYVWGGWANLPYYEK